MIRATLVGSLLLNFAFVSQAAAVSVAYEGFDYENSTTLIHNRSGGSGWSSPWVDGDQDAKLSLTADDVSLDSAAFPFTPTGDRFSVTGASEAVRALGATFDLSQDGVEFYGSFLLQQGADGGTGSDIAEFRLTTNSTSSALRLGNGSGETLYFDSGAMSGNGAATLNPTDTYFFAFKVISSAEGDDQFFASAFGPADTVPGSDPVTWDVTLNEAVDHVINGIRLQTASNVTGAVFDEIRIGETWADVAVGTPFVLGDFNNSGAIELGDLEALVSGLYVGTSYAEGDIDSSGSVDLHDYNLFREIYVNAGFSLSALPAPEPASLLSASIAVFVGASVRRRRSR